LAQTGIRFAAAAMSSSVSATPARRASAIMCTAALVEPPSAM
jgi:hypothetical protein